MAGKESLSTLWFLDKSEYKPFDINCHTVFLGLPKDGLIVGSWNHGDLNSQVLTKALRAYVRTEKLEGKQLTFSIQSRQRLNMVADGPFRHEY